VCYSGVLVTLKPAAPTEAKFSGSLFPLIAIKDHVLHGTQKTSDMRKGEPVRVYHGNHFRWSKVSSDRQPKTEGNYPAASSAGFGCLADEYSAW